MRGLLDKGRVIRAAFIVMRYMPLAGRARVGWRGSTQMSRCCATAAAIALLSMLASAASADAAPLVWSGEAASSGWSAGANWQGGAAPSLPGPVALEFPRLSGAGCTSSALVGACYRSRNDLGGIVVESLKLDDGDGYELEGDALALGTGGLHAAPAAGSSGSAGDVIGTPLELGTAQTWSVAGREGGETGENGVLLTHGISGEGDALTVDLARGAAFYLEGETAVGPLVLDGAGARGLVGFAGGMNWADGSPVSVSAVTLAGDGVVGPLMARSATVVPAGSIETKSITLDPGSTEAVQIVGDGSVRGVDYSRLASTGAVVLDGARLSVEVRPREAGGACPSPPVGQTYTLLSTPGTLNGSFEDAHEGEEVPVAFAMSCLDMPRLAMRIAYWRSGAVHEITGTLVKERTEPPQPENKYEPYEATVPQWVIEGAAASARRATEEWEARQRAAAAAGPASEQPSQPAHAAAKAHALLEATKLAVLRPGVVEATIRCKGDARCKGTLRLAVKAQRKRGRSSSRTIGLVRFSIAAGSASTVEIRLDAYGLASLRSDRGLLHARLTIVQSAPPPRWAASMRVRLAKRGAAAQS